MAAFLTRASELTPSPATRAFRALDAALRPTCRPVRSIGRGRCWPWPEGEPADDLQQARIQLVRAQLAFSSSAGEPGHPAATWPRAVGLFRSSRPSLGAPTLTPSRPPNSPVGSTRASAPATWHGRPVPRLVRPRLRTPPRRALLLDAFCALAEDNERPCRWVVPRCTRLRADRPGRPGSRFAGSGTVACSPSSSGTTRVPGLLSERHDQLLREHWERSASYPSRSGPAYIPALSGDLSAAAALVDEEGLLEEPRWPVSAALPTAR